MSNFDFLQKTDKNLYEIICDAEKLYRDEYFEQCMAQTRRFAEVVTGNILKNKNLQASTFDEMLNYLKDSLKSNPIEKEFIDDLYFLKKNGNKSVHAKKVEQNGLIALECLQRAFEIGINYFTLINGTDKKILNLNFDIDMLITGKKSTKSLSEKYIELKEKTKKEKPLTKISTAKTKIKKQNKKTIYKPVKNKINSEMSLFRKIFFTLILMLTIALCFMFYKILV